MLPLQGQPVGVADYDVTCARCAVGVLNCRFFRLEGHVVCINVRLGLWHHRVGLQARADGVTRDVDILIKC